MKRPRLNSKLRMLFDLSIKDHYSQFWDTCCDHGLLGLALLESKSFDIVHFVDQVPSIMKKLEQKLFNNQGSYQTYTMAAQDICLTNDSHLVCISGVGGDVAIDIVEVLLSKYSGTNFDFILSPQYHLAEVRHFLRVNGFRLKEEQLVFEGKWGREILLVSKGAGREIDLIGKDLFDLSNKFHLDYLQGIIFHLENKRTKSEALRKYKELFS